MIQEQASDFIADAVLPGGNFGKITLNQFKGKWIILFFYPLDFTFVCPTEIISFAERQNEFGTLNCQLLAASCDSVYTHLSWCQQSRSEGGLGPLEIPLISDYTKEIAKKYKILTSDGVPLRASFLISPEGIIKHITINDLPVGRNVDEMLRVLKAFQFVEEHGDQVCPANWRPGDRTMKPETSGSKEYFARTYGEGEIGAPRAMSPPPSSSSSASSYTVNRGVVGKCYDGVTSVITTGFENYTLSLQQSPLLTKSLTSCVISMLGELIGSYMRERNNGGLRDPVNSAKALYEKARRLAVFGFYGLVITGPFFHWWYGFIERIVSSWKLSPTLSIIMKILLDRLIATPPFLLFTLAYLQYFFTFSPEKTIQAIKNTFAVSLFTNWKVWTVIQAVNFRYVPLQYRVLFGNIAALWWNIYLSLVTAK